MQQIVHYFLHLIFPLAVAYVIFRPEWKKAYIVFLLTMLVDLDHLLASPVFDPCRCSIGFHPLHSYLACVLYVVLLFPRRTRIIATGLVMHMATDYIDCIWNSMRPC